MWPPPMAASGRGRCPLRGGTEEGRPLSGGRLLSANQPETAPHERPAFLASGDIDHLSLLRRRLRREGDTRWLGGARIEGDAAHPANLGRLCSKGAALGETIGLETRLLHPMMREGMGDLRRVTWDAALDRVAEGFRRVRAEHGPQAVAFYLSGQLLTEDYYAANKLAKGFLGTANVDTNSRLCMASSVAGHKRAFGSDTVPGSYEDLETADLIVLTGSNTAWCHPVLFRRMVAARQARGTKLVVIDPRRTTTAEEADLFLPLAHGTDAALFSGLLVHLADTGALDEAFIAQHTEGFADTLAAAREETPDLAATARITGLAEADVARFFTLFRATERAVTCYSQGVNQSLRGTDKVNAILNCHLATAASGAKAWGPSRSPASPMPWAGARWAGSPTSWPPIWASLPLKWTACAASGTRPMWRRRRG